MKSILLHLDASPRSAVRLSMAQRLARRHGACLSVFYGVLPSIMATPWAVGDGIAAAAAMLDDLDRDQRQRARAMFDAAAGASDAWLDGGDAPWPGLMQQALYHDLLIFGQPDPHDELTGAVPPDLLAQTISASGRPTLVVPRAGSFEAVASGVLLAWKPTREAARAVTAALPLLRLATRVELALAAPGDAPSDFDHGAALQHWLTLQGVRAHVQVHHMGTGDVGERLLSLAADTDAGLLVMGCYGHSRAREWVLGGVSRSILQTMTLPVLMVH